MAVYRAHSAQGYVAAAEAELQTHRLDQASRRCAACGASAPCEPANAAFAALARYGITTPADWSGDPAVVSRTPAEGRWVRQAPLMTLLAWRRTTASGAPHRRPSGAALRHPL